MKIQLYGKVIARTQRKTDKGVLYSIDIEEPGVYPSRFQLSSRDASLFGQSDGPFAVGKFVTATAFLNGAVKQVPGKNGKPFNAYRTWFNLAKLEPAESASGAAAATPQSDDQVNEDLPF